MKILFLILLIIASYKILLKQAWEYDYVRSILRRIMSKIEKEENKRRYLIILIRIMEGIMYIHLYK
jgi:hypothetical protein